MNGMSAKRTWGAGGVDPKLPPRRTWPSKLKQLKNEHHVCPGRPKRGGAATNERFPKNCLFRKHYTDKIHKIDKTHIIF